MPRHTFVSPDEISELRSLPLLSVLDGLDLYWTKDPDFVPKKDKSSIRINVSLGNDVRELVLTGPKFFDTRDEKFQGGGAIDFVMCLKKCSFKTAVAVLNKFNR
ncbi:hypothetical protein [Bacteroides sp. Phil13]|uniref:hypothetical protein n=1 Tax=Bacteroides sp. Phil13 TaxID=1929999 RepID=UPI00257CB3CD|nr:hypothetical protein [Bacteroides sp. Phil13]